MQTFLKANQINGNEKPFGIARTVFLLANVARTGECRGDLTLDKDSRGTDKLSPREAGGPIKP